MNVPDPVFLDSACIIYFIEKNPDFSEISKMVLEHLLAQRSTLVTSHLTLSEVLVKPFQNNNINLATEFFNFFRNLPNLTISNIGLTTAIKCAQIRAKFKFKPSDGMQLALAVESNCKTFLTNDRNLKPFPDLKIILLSELK